MAKEDNEVTYVSKYNRLKIVIEPSYTKEVNGQIQTIQGTTVKFEGGIFKTSDEELIETLENRPEFERDLFIRVDKDPAAEKDELREDLEAREARLEEREKALKEKERKLDRKVDDAGVGEEEEESEDEAFSDTPEPADEEEASDEEEAPDYDNMEYKELQAEAKKYDDVKGNLGEDDLRAALKEKADHE